MKSPSWLARRPERVSESDPRLVAAARRDPAHASATGYVKSSPELDLPDLRLAISPGYPRSAVDQPCTVAALRWSRRLLCSASFDRYCAEEVSPGSSLSSDEELLDDARQSGGFTFHAAGSCRMGTDDEAVVDASIMPRITSGNTHAPVVMIAEKASDMILRRHCHVAKNVEKSARSRVCCHFL